MDKIRAALDVTAPRHWQSAPDHPPTHLSYITDAEHALLKHLDMHRSGVDREDHWGPHGIPSLDGNFGGDSSSSDYGGGGGWGGSDSGSTSSDNSGSSSDSSNAGSSDSGGGWGGSDGYGGSGSFGGDSSNAGSSDSSGWGGGSGSWGGDNSGIGGGWSDSSGFNTDPSGGNGFGSSGDSWSGSNPGMMGGDNGSSSFGMDNFGGGNIMGGDQRSDPGMVGGGNSYISGGYPQGGPSTGPGTGAIGGSGQVFGTNYGPAQYTGQNPGTPNGGWVTPSSGLTSPDIPDPNAPVNMDSIISQAQNALYRAGLTNNANLGEPTYGTDSNQISYSADNPVNGSWVTPSSTPANIGDLGQQYDPNAGYNIDNPGGIIDQAQQAMYKAGLGATPGSPTYGTDSNQISYAADNAVNQSPPAWSAPSGYSGVDPANMFSAATSDLGPGINPADQGYTDPGYSTGSMPANYNFDASGQPIGGAEYGSQPPDMTDSGTNYHINPTSDPGTVIDATPVPDQQFNNTPQPDEFPSQHIIDQIKQLSDYFHGQGVNARMADSGIGTGNKGNTVWVRDPKTGKLVPQSLVYPNSKQPDTHAARGGTIDKALAFALQSSGDADTAALHTAMRHVRGRPT